MIKRILAALALSITASICFAQTPPSPFQPLGPTVTFTANLSGSIPTPVQAVGSAITLTQYIITNTGTVSVWVAYGNTSAAATTACVIPTSPPNTNTIPILPLAAYVVTLPPNYWFCGITSSSTAAVYVTPGLGV